MSLENNIVRDVVNSYGPRQSTPRFGTQNPSEIASFLRSSPTFKNRFVVTEPTLIAKPYDKNGSSTYTSVALNSGSEAGDVNRTDPSTALPMSKVTSPALNVSYQGINYYNLSPFYMKEHDVWLVVIYIPVSIPVGLEIQLCVNDQSTLGSVTNARTFTWSSANDQLALGYNILSCLHVEDSISTNEYGRVGTTYTNEWVNLGTQTDSTVSKSIRIRFRLSVAEATDTDIYFGGIYIAPQGWCKSAIIWSADDVPVSFYNLAIPLIESYGWKTTLNVTSTFAGDPEGNKMSLANVKEVYRNGHEIWGHTRLHDNLDTATLADKTQSLTSARNFWRSQGIHSASKFMAYPFGAYDTETIDLLPTLGYKLATTIIGVNNSPWIPGINPYTISRSNIELDNSWKVDSLLNGIILRGMSTFTYMHEAREGGSNTNVRPAASEFYIDHLKRWCNLVKMYENEGKVIVCTGIEYYKLCGIDPWTDEFAS